MSTPAERELAYYEDLYSGFAQQHFAKPAVAAFRRYLAARILSLCLYSARRPAAIVEIGFRLCRLLDHALIRMPLVNRWSGNIELLAIGDR